MSIRSYRWHVQYRIAGKWWKPQNGPGNMYLWRVDRAMKARPLRCLIWRGMGCLARSFMGKEPIYMTVYPTTMSDGKEIRTTTIGLDTVPGGFRKMSITM